MLPFFLLAFARFPFPRLLEEEGFGGVLADELEPSPAEVVSPAIGRGKQSYSHFKFASQKGRSFSFFSPDADASPDFVLPWALLSPEPERGLLEELSDCENFPSVLRRLPLPLLLPLPLRFEGAMFPLPVAR